MSKYGSALGALKRTQEPESPKASEPETPIPREPEDQNSGSQEIQNSGKPDRQNSGSPAKKKAGKAEVQLSGIPENANEREKYSTILPSDTVKALKVYAVMHGMKDWEVVDAALRAYLKDR